MRPLPTGLRVVGFALIGVLLFGPATFVAWGENQPIAAGISGLIAIALFVRAVILLVRLNKQKPREPIEADDPPRWGR